MSLWGTYLETLLDLSFNGKSLQSITGGQIVNHNFEEMPEIRSSQNAVSSSHRSITAGRFFVSKRASVDIAVAGEFHELQAILGRVRQLIQYKSKDLVLTRGVPIKDGTDYDLDQTTTMTFREANMVSANLAPDNAKGRVITIDFLIDDPVGVGDDVQSIFSANGITASSTAIDLSAIDIQGTFQEQYPLYTIVINSVTNGSTPSIEIELGLTTITIEHTFVAADVVTINTDTQKVYVNGEMIDFNGAIPFIADTDATIYIRDTFTARNIDIDVDNAPRYI